MSVSNLKVKRIISAAAFLLAAAVCLSACSFIKGYVPGEGTGNGTENGSAGSQISGAEPGSASSVTVNVATDFSSRDINASYSAEDAVTVVLKDGASEADGGNVDVSGDVVTITAGGTYIIKGSLSDGRIVVNAPKTDKLQLVLDGVSVKCAGFAALYVVQADKVVVTAAEGTVNAFETEGAFSQIDDNNVDGAVFSKEDVSFNGNGKITVKCGEGNGIVGKDDVVFYGSFVEITAAEHGIQAKDSLKITESSFSVNSGKDAIHCANSDDTAKGNLYVKSGSFVFKADGDGVDVSGALRIDGGSFDVTAGEYKGVSGGQSQFNPWGGGRPGSGYGYGQTSQDTVSTKGIKADGTAVFNGGTFVLVCADDAIHSNTTAAFGGGTFTLTSGDDGIHADSEVVIDGGNITIAASYEGIEGEKITVNGGRVDLTSSDDGFNASAGNSADGAVAGNPRGGYGGYGGSTNCSLTINGGFVKVNASGDGLDSNGILAVNGGEIYVSGPTNSGNGAIDYENSGVITGGVLIAAGASGMAQNFGSSSTQGSILLTSQTAVSGGTEITLKDSKGNVIASFTPEKNFNSVVVSAPEIKQGGTYTLTAGSWSETVKMTSLVYGGGGQFGPGGQGGPGGHGGRPGRP